jgi:NTP pyrophosphatase (non-canonical NTP hydrolase)
MAKPTDNRPQITDDTIATANHLLQLQLKLQLEKKGGGTWVSSHEILGIITEEYYELIEAVKNNNEHRIKAELLDLGVAVLFAVACINNGKLDWL